jgi:hypothetical protein
MFWKRNGNIVDHHFAQQAIVIQKLLKPKQKTSHSLPQHLFFLCMAFLLLPIWGTLFLSYIPYLNK